MSEQDSTSATILQRPSNNDKETWKDYWKVLGQPWRTEPEIDLDRQKFLTERSGIIPNVELGLYRFKDVMLSREDVEWLLVTHKPIQELINWSEGHHQSSYGLDLQGANLRDVDLSGLPLTRLLGSSISIGQEEFALERYSRSIILLQGANLKRTDLGGALLRGAHLEGAVLHETLLRGVNLRGAHLEGADLYRAQLQDAYLREAHLQGANLQGAFLDNATNLTNVILSDEQYGTASLADIHWGDVNLAVVRWAQVNILGEEYKAGQKNHKGETKNRSTRLQEYEDAVRANRQLAVTLQEQGLNEVAARFAYRAQKLQRVVLRRERKFGAYLFSLILDVLAGYGYKLIRSVIWYLIIIFGFAMAYYVFGHLPFFPDVFVFSLTSFHGRGFFPGLGNETSLHNPLVVLAATEAVIGLFIEISFIATFTKRFFGSQYFSLQCRDILLQQAATVFRDIHLSEVYCV